MRSSARKEIQNRRVKSKLRTLERQYVDELTEGQKEEAALALRDITSAFDKAAKTGVVHPSRANRKKSRLTQLLNKKQ
jgi:small subunit ribosomal protein S20